MEKEFVPYELAVKLKELGFDEPCFGRYGEIDNLEFRFFKEPKSFNYGLTSKTCLAPTFSQAFRFFREKYKLKSWIEVYIEGRNNYIYEIRPHKSDDYKEGEVYVFETHEETELACLTKLIEIVESKSE